MKATLINVLNFPTPPANFAILSPFSFYHLLFTPDVIPLVLLIIGLYGGGNQLRRAEGFADFSDFR